MTRMHPGFTGLVQDGWPRPRGWMPPQRLDLLDVATLPGVGVTLAKRLSTFGIQTVRDLLFHAPRRYENAVDQVPIAKLGQAEGEVAIEGRIVSARSRPLQGRRTLVTAVVRDSSGGQISASFFNQPWLLEKLTPGTSLRLRGKLGKYGFDVKSYDIGEARRTADHAPVYPASEQIPSTRLRELVRTALAQHAHSFPDPLPAELELPLRRDALAAIHFPTDEGQAEQARQRLPPPPRPWRVSRVEVVDHHPPRGELGGDVPDRRPHHLHPPLRDPVLVALEVSRHHLALQQSIKVLRLGLVIHPRPIQGGA